jgi:hypothetical protein
LPEKNAPTYFFNDKEIKFYSIDTSVLSWPELSIRDSLFFDATASDREDTSSSPSVRLSELDIMFE